MKKNRIIKRLLILFVVVAIIFGIYSIFFSDKANNMKYYIDPSTHLVSSNDFMKFSNNVNRGLIDDLLVDLSGNLSKDEINKIKDKYKLDNTFTNVFTNLFQKKQKRNIYVYEDFLVNFRDNVTPEQIKEIEKKYKIKLELNSAFSVKDKLYVFNSTPRDSASIINTLNKLTDESTIEYAQPSYVYSIYQNFDKESGEHNNVGSNSSNGISREGEFKPNDPRYSEQWNMKDIETGIAWNKTKGKGAVVAVIDTGVSNVEDLDPKRFVAGYNFVKKNSNAADDHGHGTHVAGTIAQWTNNGKGVAGIAFEAKIMPLKVLNKNGFGNIADIAEAIKWAADHGANIINMSLGGGGRTQVMEDAIKYAQKKGVVVVAAAGNENRNKASYPAYYKGVVSVASYGPKGARAFYSNYGDGVRISAPGGDDRVGGTKGKILQNTISGYEWYQGTSMASPHVAGVAALIYSSGVKDANKIIDILYKSARKVNNDSKNEFGAGRLSAKNAVKMAMGESIPTKGELTQSPIKLFIYIIAIIIGLVIFLIWYRKNKMTTHNLSFIPFVIGILLSTIGFIFPSLISNNAVTRVLSSSIPNMDVLFFGSFTPLFHSALIPFIFVLLLSGSRLLKSFSVAICLGFATVFVVDAFVLFSDVSIIPNFTPLHIVDRIFLLINAVICLILGFAVSTKSE